LSSNPSNQVKDDSIVAKPEVLKNWKMKLLVLLLCGVSFFAGWQASRSHMVKECQLAGAQVTVENRMVICDMPQ